MYASRDMIPAKVNMNITTKKKCQTFAAVCCTKVASSEGGNISVPDRSSPWAFLIFTFVLGATVLTKKF